MRRKLISLASIVLVLAFTSAMQARAGGHGGGHGGGHAGSHGSSSHAGNKGTGTKNNSGSKNTGSKNSGSKNSGSNHGSNHHGSHHGSRSRNFRGWSDYCVFDNGCYGYYCSCDATWYYWYGPEDTYLPVCEMATYPPDNSTPPMLPPGARRLP